MYAKKRNELTSSALIINKRNCGRSQYNIILSCRYSSPNSDRTVKNDLRKLGTQHGSTVGILPDEIEAPLFAMNM